MTLSRNVTPNNPLKNRDKTARRLQMSLITAIVYFPEREHTVKSVTEKYGVARSTAVKALETLVSAGVMTKSGGSGRTPVIFTGRKSHRKLREGLINLQRG